MSVSKQASPSLEARLACSIASRKFGHGAEALAQAGFARARGVAAMHGWVGEADPVPKHGSKSAAGLAVQWSKLVRQPTKPAR